jgi:ankyrin repeat protein
MKKLLLILILLTGAHSLHGMDEPKQLSPITLPQIYYHLAEILNQDVARYIFECQPGTSEINNDILLAPVKNRKSYYETNNIDCKIDLHLLSLGYCLTFEKLNRNLARKKISICDIKSHNGSTLLHRVVIDQPNRIDAVKLYLQVAGNDVTKLLTTQTDFLGWTVLHYAASDGRFELVKLFLDAAGNNAQTLLGIGNQENETAFDVATTPEIKELMQQYQKKNQ